MPLSKAIKIPKGYEKGETSYRVTSETNYWPKPKPVVRRGRPSVAAPKPMEVKVVNPVRIKQGRKLSEVIGKPDHRSA